jgi:hypothetical protein
MKTASKICFQGDVAFVRVGALPKDAQPREGKDANVVAHSETGHHHIARGADCFFVPNDPMVCYLRLAGDEALIEHLRPHDTHETIALGGGAGAVWQGRRQREHTPEGWRAVQD